MSEILNNIPEEITKELNRLKVDFPNAFIYYDAVKYEYKCSIFPLSWCNSLMFQEVAA